MVDGAGEGGEVVLAEGSAAHVHAPQPCERFSRAGRRCANRTRHADRWCRQPGCDGFRRASTSAAPPPPLVRPTSGQNRPPQNAGDAAPMPLDAVAVRITTAAIDSYRYHHGGQIDSAERELRAMIADFAETAKVRSFGQYIGLARNGYRLIFDADGDVLTGYATVHRERTWAQHQAGVPSRFPGGTSSGGRGRQNSSGGRGRQLKEPAEYQALACHPASVMIHRRDLKSFAIRMNLGHLSEAELDAALRQFIANLGPDNLGAVRIDDTVEFTRGDVRIVFSADQHRVLKVFWPRRPDMPDEA
ncbi:hypothetical protein ACI8AA_01160 [Geodermatophilus sp. SYSU D01180]